MCAQQRSLHSLKIPLSPFHKNLNDQLSGKHINCFSFFQQNNCRASSGNSQCKTNLSKPTYQDYIHMKMFHSQSWKRSWIWKYYPNLAFVCNIEYTYRMGAITSIFSVWKLVCSSSMAKTWGKSLESHCSCFWMEEPTKMAIINQTLELFMRQCWGNIWEMQWSAHGLFYGHGYYLELNWMVIAEEEKFCAQKRWELCPSSDPCMRKWVSIPIKPDSSHNINLIVNNAGGNTTWESTWVV